MPKDVPRCGVVSLLQKPLHYRKDSAEIAAGLKKKKRVSGARCVAVPASSLPFRFQIYVENMKLQTPRKNVVVGRVAGALG